MKKVFILILLTTLLSFAQTTKPWLDYQFPTIIADNDLWIGTPTGLYQYHYEEDSWSLYGLHNGLPDNHIQILRWDNEYLWVATPKGLAQGDIRLNKWLLHTQDNGLPSNQIYSIEFQEDYVWIGTDQGAARYDKLIEEWERFDSSSGLPDTLIYDIAVNEDLVYFGSAKGLAEYDVNFEKWRYFSQNEGLPSDTIHYIYQTTENLWLFTPAGPCRFNKQRYTTVSYLSDHRLNYENIRFFQAVNDQFWVATTSDVLIYDPNSNAWREYQESVNLPGKQVNGMSISQESSWFVTQDGVANLDEQTKTWQYVDQTHGLSMEQFNRVAKFRGRIFLINSQTIDYYKPSENRWYNHALISSASQKKGQYPSLSLNREHGSYLQMNDNLRLSLNGTRITSLFKSQGDYDLDSKTWKTSEETGNRMDVKGQLSLGKDRTLNGFYNNVDETEVMYGVRYRGQQDDLIQEVNWGDVRFEHGKHQLLNSSGIFGASARIEAGPKTDQYKRSLLSFNTFGGERTTGSELEFLTGNVKSGQFLKLDMDYVKHRYFALDTANIINKFESGREILYLDDGLISTDDKNTQSMILAGVSGNFDRLYPTLDYTVNASGIIQLLKPIPENATLIINLQHTQHILQHENFTTELSNHYTLGIRDILPYSFQLTIRDTLDQIHPLHKFGLDKNNDGYLDPEWIDYHQGVLSFPEHHPFPSKVYLDDPISCFQMEYTFQTELSFFTLKHDSLIRGSETLLIDGEILTPGQDYVLDYTVGSLIIIKEGILAEDSEIQIEYEYYKNTDQQFYLAGMSFGPSDNILIEASGYQFENQEGNSKNPIQGANVWSEFKGKIKSWNFKLTPEFGQTSDGHVSGNSIYVRSDISSSKFRLYGLLEKIDSEFQSLLPKKFQLGNLRQQKKSGITIYPFRGLDLIGQWQQQESQPTETGYRNQEKNISGKVLFSRNQIPAVSISLRDQLLDTESRETRKQTMKSEVEYVVPKHYMQRLSLNTLRFYSVWRHSQEKNILEDQQGNTAYIYDNFYLRMDFSPVDQIQINGYFRDQRARLADVNYNPIQMLNQKQKLFIDAIMDRINGINLNMRYQGEIHEFTPFNSRSEQQYTLYRRLESSMRIFPGRWISSLSPFTFQITIQPFWQGNLRNAPQDLRWTEKFWATKNRALTSSTNNNLYQLRGEWRPSPAFLFYSRYDHQTIQNTNQQSRFDTQINRFNQKIEFRPSLNALITVQYFRTNENKGDYSNTIRDNPMLWIDKRWNERLQTKFNITYWREVRNIGKMTEDTYTLSPLLGLTYRFYNRKDNSNKGEIRNDFSTSFYRRETAYVDQSQNTYTNNLSIDLFPASVFILRGRWSVTYIDLLKSNLDRISNLVELRLIAQF
ncbi:hypothetical protein ACFL4L_02790 [bacterium]